MNPSAARRSFVSWDALCAVLACVLAACAGNGPSGPAPSPTPSATASVTATPTPTASPTATPTPTTPPHTPTASPSASPTTSSTASPTLTPEVARTPIVAHLDEPLGPVNTALLGVGWNTGTLEYLGPFAPPSVRIDAHLDAVSPAPGELQLDPLLAAVARVRALGAEPLVILYPMPPWLGAERAATCTVPVVGGPCSPEYVAPADLDTWEQLIETVVRALASAPQAALRFEAWNEPDLFTFWQDTRDAFYVTAVRTHRAVARVATDTGLPLQIGGPAASYFEVRGFVEGTDAFLAGYVQAVVDAGVPLHFVSWHWYANYPHLGPDGNEGNVSEEIYNILAGINRIATPHSYTTLTERVRGIIDPILQPAGRTPALGIDEWNLSAGGYDLRNDSYVGAAFAAGSLIEMERVGLDTANVYRAISSGDHVGDWGIVTADGTKKPLWWVFRAWSQMPGERLRVDGDDAASGLWARAVSANGAVQVLLASFRAVGAPPRALRLDLDGTCAAHVAEVGVLDADSASFETLREQPVVNGSLSIDLGGDAVVWVRLHCAAA
jgi:hypothetical protein